jgi:hypothetical protein
MSVQVPYWTIQIKRGVDFGATLTFRSEGVEFSFDAASIIVNPQMGGQVEWTQANGKFTNTGTGIYAIAVQSTETSAYSWNYADWRLSVVRDGEPNPSFIAGKVYVS